MRKKFFISVYSVGIYFTDKLAAARAGAAKGQRVQTVLANANNEALGLLITFQRDVEVEKIAEAFVSALGSGDAAYLKDKAALQSILLSPAGAYAKGSTIEFTFNGRGRLGASLHLPCFLFVYVCFSFSHYKPLLLSYSPACPLTPATTPASHSHSHFRSYHQGRPSTKPPPGTSTALPSGGGYWRSTWARPPSSQKSSRP